MGLLPRRMLNYQAIASHSREIASPSAAGQKSCMCESNPWYRITLMHEREKGWTLLR